MSPMPAVGNSVARKDGIGKATGAALYADDRTTLRRDPRGVPGGYPYSISAINT